jgi:hypothetical protein
MIRKSGHRFSEKNMLNKKTNGPDRQFAFAALSDVPRS